MHQKLRHLLSLLFGDFSWHPPGWLARGSGASAAWVRTHRALAALLALLVLAATAGAWEARQWYLHRPRPVTITVKVIPPQVTRLEKKLIPDPLTLLFGASVAKLEDQGGTGERKGRVTSGVRISPPVEGSWQWVGDDRLVLYPKNDWPAGQEYEITLDRSLFPEHVLLESYEVKAKTPAFTASMPKILFYTNPTDQPVKQVVATLEFTHPVDLAELQKHLELAAIGGSEIFPAGAPRFILTAGLHQRVVYLRTSALTLPEQEDFLRITLAAGTPTTLGGAVTASPVEGKVRVPDLYSFFRIASTKGQIVHNKEGDPEQILLIETTGAAKSEEIQRALHVYLLPKNDGKGDEKEWKSPKEIDEDVLEKATVLPFKLIPPGQENSELHSFKISLETAGQLYVTIDKGVRALGGFMLGEAYGAVLPVPELPREIEIQGEGGVLALSGERKLSIKSRGVRTIEYEIARVPADQINHLVSQTRGEFQNPEFVNYNFGRDNIARIATEKQSINVVSQYKANYSAFDFGKYLKPADDGGSALQGLFFLRAREWQPPKKKTEAEGEETEEEGADGDDSEEEAHGAATGDGRFLLLTDLGLVVKENADTSREIYIASIKTGAPLPGVTVQVLAKNGVPMIEAETDATGHLTLPSLGKPTREKTPVAFVARKGNDVAFMPYARADRKLDFSRFDTGGVESRTGQELDAFVFTERGIYRPGDEIRIGLIVKQRDWGGRLEGLPIETEIIDARDNTVQVRKLALPEMGFAETSYQTAYESPTGEYTINAYLVRNGKRDSLLGETTVHVKEFLPDRMKIESHLSKEPKSGWVTPEGVKAAITLRNLYGTAASARRVTSHLVLSPADFRFEEYPGFTFYDRLRDDEKKLKRQEVDLGETHTDEAGAASFDLNLERFADATYSLSFLAEGFEADSGRSVATRNTLLVSPLAYVIGAKPDGDFSYVPLGSARAVQWVAIDPALQKLAVPGLACRLVEHTYVSVLSKRDDGNYEYESVARDRVVRSEPVSLGADGLQYALPTDVPGDYVLELCEQEGGARLSRVSFTVVGRGAVTRSLEKNAELQVKLAREHYSTGDEIELSIVAPYTGSGLITIERDKVYAHAWFKADRTSTVQHIRVPAELEGTGYVNVCFIRALDSKEVFMSPLSYAAVPFQANVEKRRLPITLRAPAKARPGEPLRIAYKTDRPARIAIFAVDQGILQVSDYQLPNPLAHFYRKAALMVETRQIVDLILPEFSILRSASAFGGDGEKLLNPFKRVTEKPVVFWSGIVDAGPREHEVVYDVPDYFSGTLTIMAVAVAPDAVGSTETSTLERGPFVLTPNVPTVAAPGDTFDVSVTIANGLEGSGPAAEVQFSALPSEHLEIVQKPASPLLIDEGREVSATFTVRAREKLGSASLVFHASAKGEEAKIRSTLSVRPAVPFVTTVQSGRFTGSSAELKIERALHPDFRKLEACVSALPLGLARGLDIYLHNYPNGCSEQITSGALSRLLLADETDFGLSRKEVTAQLEHTFAILRRRQNDQGSFGYWTVESGEHIDFVSVYVTHFLIEAKEAGFAPPAGVLEAALKHLQAIAVLDPHDLREARVQAYAIYLLTRQGLVTTNYLLNLREYLDRAEAKRWPGDLTAVYLAGAWSLLKKSDEAERLIKGYKPGSHKFDDFWDFHSALGSDSQYFAILARHFPDRLKKVSPTDFQCLLKPIGSGYFNTLSAAYAVLALKSYTHLLKENPVDLGLTEITPPRESAVRLEGGPLLKRAPFSPQASMLRFTAKGALPHLGVFYQAVETGYDTALPTTSLQQGLEVFRELVDAEGKPTQTVKLGAPLTVRLRLRSLRREPISNVAIVDLLPGGFEFAADGLKPGAGSAGFDYVELREDRAIFFGTIDTHTREVTYQIKATNRGDFVVPPAFAESMYDRTVYARALAGRVRVVDAP